MAAAIVVEELEANADLPDAESRRVAVDSVLGTMAAEGELPSAETLFDFERYVRGEIGIDQLTDLVLHRALS